MQRARELVIALLLLSLILTGMLQWQWDLTVLEQWMTTHRTLGMVAYVLFAIASVVLLPFSSLPLLPLAARLFGIVPTALLSIAGWWIGSLLAFLIARWSRPYLGHIASLEKIDQIATTIPSDIGFIGIVTLRMVLPTDLVSFALGLIRPLSFRLHAIATLIGIIPFAFVWSAAGGQLAQGQFLTTGLLLSGMLLAVLLLRYIWEQRRS
jgi:uncharacterized membrane protein YdjX (TVP38/TMEM64 family)